MTLAAYIGPVAFAAPGVLSWQDLEAAIAQGNAWEPEPWEPMPAGLSPRQAKRLSPAIRLAFASAEALGEVPEETAWVFASSVGEGETLDVILRGLSTQDMMIQPLRFQNAVHNAASGQWSIAAGITGPVTSIAAYDETVGAGLVKALTQAWVERRPVALICFDAPIPVPLDEKRPLGVPMAAGLLLRPDAGEGYLARISCTVGPVEVTAPESSIAQALLATGNPIAAILPLLECLSQRRAGKI
ncbi:MAG: beta-ketoacyl synthase chain length factor, partial [Pseudomonadota bacterium]